ncbi:MAG TPA: hypothetical protein VND64_15820 [Pirellulales bacterium]|nr:hypothetical protein [Pirellulales bacterium]
MGTCAGTARRAAGLPLAPVAAGGLGAIAGGGGGTGKGRATGTGRAAIAA